MTEGSDHGDASNALTWLAEDGLVVKTAYARTRINGLHPELVALRLKMSQGDLDRIKAREREIREAEKRRRAACCSLYVLNHWCRRVGQHKKAG